jgi:hypothetical protein
MARCPRCGCTLEIEYDREGFACGAECTICDWPEERVECPKCDEEMSESKVQEEVVLDGEEVWVCEPCAEGIREEE